MRRTRLVLIVVVVAVLVMATLSTLLIFFALSKADSHEPIAIYGDSSFTAKNGVRSGSGTGSDPYVIEGWKLHISQYGSYGIRIQDTKAFFVIRNVTIEGSNGLGIYFAHVENGFTHNCTFKGLTFGLDIQESANLSLKGNQFLDCVEGLDIGSSVDCSLEMNTFEAESRERPIIYSAALGGGARIALSQNRFNTGGLILRDMFDKPLNISRSNLTTYVIGSDNLADGAAIRFYINRVGLTLENIDLGQLFLMNCSNADIKDVRFAPGTTALNIAWCNNVTIDDCVIPAKYAQRALQAYKSDNLKIKSCNISEASSAFANCSGFELTQNSMSGSPGHSANVDIYSSDNFTFANNSITRCDSGMSMQGTDNATIIGNTILGCTRGLYVYSAASTHIYNNNFIDNGKNVEAVIWHPPSSRESISWTDGYPIGGNYWSNYTGSDMFQGPNQDQSGSDGIGDVPYRIDAMNVDQYPLIDPR